jgi:hypothetical protein
MTWRRFNLAAGLPVASLSTLCQQITLCLTSAGPTLAADTPQAIPIQAKASDVSRSVAWSGERQKFILLDIQWVERLPHALRRRFQIWFRGLVLSCSHAGYGDPETAHYDPDRSIAASFQALPGAPFVVNGAAQAADSALTTASIERKWANGFSLSGTFEGEFSNVTRSYAGKAVARYVW